jgi:hypothetical protein
VPSRINSPLDALTTSQLATTASGSMGGIKGEGTRRRTFGGHTASNETGKKTPRIDLSAPSRRLPRSLVEESELPNIPIRTASSSTGAQSTSSGRGYGSGGRKPRASMPALIPQSRRSSLLPNVSASLPSPSQSLDFPISESDRSFIMQHGIQTIIDKLAVNHGFQPSVTWNVYKLMKDLPTTEEVLKKMKESANNAVLNVMKKIGAEDGEGRNDEETYDDEDDSVDSEVPDNEDEDARQNRYLNPRGGLGLSNSLRGSSSRWRWRPAEGNTEYSPEKHTRAGEWVRLEMQGRTREALSRESRRASLSAARKLQQVITIS